MGGGSCRLLKIPNFTAGLFEDIDVSFIIMRCVQICTKKEGKEGKFTDSRITGSLAHRSMAVKPEGEGLQSMGGLIPKENIEEGDDTTKIQVKLFLMSKKIHTLSFYPTSACPCTPSCSPWTIQPSTISLSTSREQSCQC